METNWTLRKVLSNDADRIAAHGQYRDEHAHHRPGYAAWVRPRIEAGAYLGWLAIAEGAVIAGAGAVLLDWGPTRSNPCGQMARIVNVFTDEAWRRQGIARTLMGAVLRDCEAKGIREFNLAASPEAHPLYVALGFDAYPAEMRRRVAAI
jgi:GNAT superfamily N-acetyltransferase